MGIVTTIEANVKEPGEIVLNAKLLSSMISRMPAGQITISLPIMAKPPSERRGAVRDPVHVGHRFPRAAQHRREETLTIKTGVLRDMIDRTLYAVSQDEKKNLRIPVNFLR